MTSDKRPFPDPEPEAEWEVWSEDMFDRETPRRVELSGHALAAGLAELWARHLSETVQADGTKGFYRFNLWWKQRENGIGIDGDWEGAVRLRVWIYGTDLPGDEGYGSVEADGDLLELVATAHAQLVLGGQSAEPVLLMASTAADRQDFEEQLRVLAAKPPQ